MAICLNKAVVCDSHFWRTRHILNVIGNNTESTMKEIFLLILTISLLSCNSEKTQKGETTDEDGSIVEMKPTEIKGDTSFLDFLEEFMWDKEFQQSRVLFPIQQNGNEIKTSKEWKHLSFYIQSQYIPTLASDTINIFDKDVNLEKTEVYIIDFKVDSVETFAFEKANSNWHLIKVGKTTLENTPDYEFIDFMTKFANDSNFQINHISFPISESFADSDNNYETASKLIKLEDWKFWELTDEINRLMILSNMQTDSKYRNIFFRGIENGIWVQYTFEKIGENWKLIRLEDYST